MPVSKTEAPTAYEQEPSQETRPKETGGPAPGPGLNSAHTAALAHQGTAGNRAVASAMAAKTRKDPVSRDNQKLQERMSRIHAFRDGVLAHLMDKYVLCLTNGRDAEAINYLNWVLDELDRVRAFEIPFHMHNYWWDRGEDSVSYEAARRTQEIHLWSKMTQLQAMKAAKDNGISLEGSLGGWLFDGLSWGVAYSESNAMKHQWGAISERFVSHTGRWVGETTSQPAVVHAHVLMGIAANSVLHTTEWETIAKKMEQKQVSKVVVHRYLMDGIQGSVSEHDTQEVVGAEAWKDLMKEGRRKDDGQSGVVVKIGTVKTPTGVRTVVARLALYMSDADWRTMKYYTVPNDWNRSWDELPYADLETPEGPYASEALSPVYSSGATVRKSWNEDEDPESGSSPTGRAAPGPLFYGDTEREGTGIQNLVQTRQKADLKKFEKDLWLEGQVAKMKQDYLLRLDAASEKMGR